MSDNDGCTRLTPSAAAEAIEAGALLIDVRSEVGRGRDGELQGAVVIAKTDVVGILSKRMRKVAEDEKIVVFCGSVKGSAPVIDALVSAGFRSVYDVDGGFPALRDHGLPLIPRASSMA